MTAADESRVVWRHEAMDVVGDKMLAFLESRGYTIVPLAARSEPRAWPQSESHYDATWQKPDPTVSEPRAEGLREALRFISYLWTATGIDPAVHVCDLFSKGDPIQEDILRFDAALSAALAATPPTEGLDVERLVASFIPEATYHGSEVIGRIRALAPEQPE